MMIPSTRLIILRATFRSEDTDSLRRLYAEEKRGLSIIWNILNTFCFSFCNIFGLIKNGVT